MKKIYIDAVLEKNLGDDLFIYIITNRYKNCKFYTQTNYSYKKYQKEDNLKIYSGFFIKLINKFMSKFFKKGKFCGQVLRNKCDYVVGIGGSIFAEWGKIETIKKHFSIYNTSKPYYILGSNFGPYKTEEYKSFIRNDILKNAEDVCFRENYSYEIFKDLPNVRQAPDIVFSLDMPETINENSKKAVISVIDCEKKVGKENKNLYEEKIIEMIEMFYLKGYEVTLMSFCKAEGDEKAIKSIINKMTNKDIKEKLKIYFYNGNIDEALNIISDCEIIVGTRFHANILGLVMNKTIIPISYSDKTINSLKDINFKGKIFDIRDINNFDINSLTDEDLNYKLDISLPKEKAIDHFKKLDLKIIEGETNE